MPRIDDSILECSAYFYPSVASANAREKLGGSGFFVSVKSKRIEDKDFLYLVTNSHVIREGDALVIRINTSDGSSGIWETKKQDWIHHPDGDDIAAIEARLFRAQLKCKSVSDTIFITKEITDDFDIGVGDEVFMVGRFINHEGRQKNQPAVRFGNISMMPYETVVHPTRHIDQESFLVEMRSISGFSGSPVFVTIDLSIPRPRSKTMRSSIRLGGEPPRWLLGVDWGHISDSHSIIESDGTLHRDGLKVMVNTNLAAVLPAWKLRELIDEDSFSMSRFVQEQVMIAKGMKPLSKATPIST